MKFDRHSAASSRSSMIPRGESRVAKEALNSAANADLRRCAMPAETIPKALGAAQGRHEDLGASVKPRYLQQYHYDRCGVDGAVIRGSSRRSPGAHPTPDDQADEANALRALPLRDWIAMRLRIPATPSEIAHSARVPLRSVRATLYQLRDQGRAIRLDRRVPKASPRVGSGNTCGGRPDGSDQGCAQSLPDLLGVVGSLAARPTSASGT
jgi:hypothetical protein